MRILLVPASTCHLLPGFLWQSKQSTCYTWTVSLFPVPTLGVLPLSSLFIGLIGQVMVPCRSEPFQTLSGTSPPEYSLKTRAHTHTHTASSAYSYCSWAYELASALPSLRRDILLCPVPSVLGLGLEPKEKEPRKGGGGGPSADPALSHPLRQDQCFLSPGCGRCSSQGSVYGYEALQLLRDLCNLWAQCGPGVPGG